MLGVVLFQAFASHLRDIPRARAAQALSALMAGEGEAPSGGDDAFAYGFRIVMWICAVCAAAGGMIGGILVGRRTG